MNKLTTAIAIAALAGTALAQNARQLRPNQTDTQNQGKVQNQDRPQRSQAPRHSKRQENRREALKHFDTDGDGTLSDAELAAAKAAFDERREQMHERMLERFDADGDGVLSEEERLAAREQFSQRRGEGPDGQFGDGPRPFGRRGPPPPDMGDFDAEGPGPQGRRGPPPEVIEQFDLDGDGQLNEAERQAAHEQLGQMRPDRPRRGPESQRGERRFGPPPEVLEQFDADGDGQLNETERQAARARFEAHRAEVIERFDADGDGRLGAEERDLARAAFQQERRIRRFDTDRDGSFSQTELAEALELIGQGDAKADLNADGIVDINDAQLLIEFASEK